MDNTIYSKLESKSSYIIQSYGEKSTVDLANEFNCNPGTIYLFLKNNGVKIKSRSNNYGETDKYLDTICKLHAENMSSYAISKKIGLPKCTVLRIAKKIGLSFSSKTKLTNPIRMKDQEKLIKEMHENGESSNKIAKQLGYSPSQVSQFLNKLGYELTHIKYDADIHFFDKIDNEVKAYILGFWYADGNVQDDKIRLQITDLDILERIQQEMSYQGPLYINPPKKSNHKTQYCLSIARTELVESLIKCGCVKNKTLTLTFPADVVPEHLIRHFIRGYIDGDGNIYYNKKQKTLRCQIVGTKEFLSGIEIVLNEIGVNVSWSKRKKDLKNNYNIVIGGNIQVIKFLDWLYSDSTIFLQRKYNIYENFRCIYSSQRL